MFFLKVPLLKVLLVDDDEDDCAIFEQVLQEIAPGTTLVCLSKGENIVEDVNQIGPDIIFLDINLPKVNGIDCLKALSKTTSCQHIPVVIYSALDSNLEITKALNLGAVQYIKKAYTFTELVEQLRTLVNPYLRA